MNAVVREAPAVNPFAQQEMSPHVNHGTVHIEQSRAITEAQGKLLLAKQFPRNEATAYAKVMAACSRPSLAAVGEYAFPRGGETVRGPSIRLAEELARCWGNIDYGIRELSRTDGASEMEAYAWDLETNTYSSQKFTVKHVRDRKGGAAALTTERDIYELTANMGGRRLRARLLAILPPDLVEAAVEQCRKTLQGKSDEPITDRVRRILVSFGKLGVTEKHIAGYLNKPVDQILPEDIADLQGVYNSIKAGQALASEFFNLASHEKAEAKSLNDQLAKAASVQQQSEQQ